MAAGSSQPLISELKDALVRFPQNRHTLVIQRVIELFIDQEGQSPHQLEALDEVLVCLIRHADLADLERLSNAIAKSGLMLPSTIATLAAHERASIATPLLRNSKWVTEQSRRTDRNARSETSFCNQLESGTYQKNHHSTCHARECWRPARGLPKSRRRFH